jgi:hypothetical protein
MPLPHTFRNLGQDTGGAARPSLLVLGAGMSWGLVPSPDELYRTKRASAEEQLGLASTLPLNSTDLYEWADDMLARLRAAGNPNPKLSLSASLDIPADRSWGALVRAEESTPRHRVVARFAREGLWEQIWSFNWDCLQENALENVGITRDGPESGSPWPTRFRCFVTAEDCANLGEEQRYTVKIIKPHGCAMKLVEAEQARSRGDDATAITIAERFLITRSELANLAPVARGDGTQQFIFAQLTSAMSTQPVIIVGWRATEEYLLRHFENTLTEILGRRQLSDDELSIVDLEFNDNGHSRIASVYQRDKNLAHIPVQATGFTTDRLFLWIQALYALECLSCAVPNDRNVLDEAAAEIQEPPGESNFIIDWADVFLPAWVLLCWRYGSIRCLSRLNNQIIEPEDIEMDADEHIPWGYLEMNRPDLRAASSLLAALYRRRGGAWDFRRYPGGLFSEDRLVIPIPAWDNDMPNDLRSLKKLITVMKKHGDAYIQRIAILPLTDEANGAVPAERIIIFKALVARELAMARITQDNIEHIQLVDL